MSYENIKISVSKAILFIIQITNLPFQKLFDLVLLVSRASAFWQYRFSYLPLQQMQSNDQMPGESMDNRKIIKISSLHKKKMHFGTGLKNDEN